MVPKCELKNWTRAHEGQKFLCTTDPKYIQLDTLNAALGSNMMWWARPMPEAELRKMVDHSLCLGLYLVDERTAGDDESSYPMVGFARLITDYVSFAYLTDVYILPEHQGKGLGKWMMECLNEILDNWPNLRRFLLLTGDLSAVRLYQSTLGMEVVQPGKLAFMQKVGPAAPDYHP
ncbi:acyl-CoA N-acyltransferase [Coniochaeta sp. 2T2.1]|nr:acyl-CoA N-acyltransferase [Coniochaeta sp. 2T2.1]